MKHVLLLEDDHEVRILLQRALEERGYCVTFAGSLAQALPVLERVKVELLIADVVLPDGTAMQAMEFARQKGIPGFLMTGSVEHMAQLDGDGTYYLAKPFRPTQFLEQVRGHIGAARERDGPRVHSDGIAKLAQTRRWEGEAMPRILVVEDDAAYAVALKAELRHAGFEVEVAADTMAALTKTDAQSYDLFLVDVIMPAGKPNGFTFGRMMRYRHPTTPVVFMTAYEDMLQLAPAQDRAEAFAKSDVAALVSQVQSHLAGETT